MFLLAVGGTGKMIGIMKALQNNFNLEKLGYLVLHPVLPGHKNNMFKTKRLFVFNQMEYG